MSAPDPRSDDAPAGGVPDGTPDVGFGVYVHWPFCQSKCPYCDFNSHVRHGGVDQADFSQALAGDLAAMAARTPARRVTSIFFGGGTPSLMAPSSVERILTAIHRHWTVDEGAEVTLEANPTSAEARNFEAYRACGINRVSIGVQSLDDRALKFLGRRHTAREALAAVAAARRSFARVSFDLIYARPGQAPGEWQAELGQALELGPDHLSVYQLTIEPGTAFAELHASGALETADDDAAAELYDLTQQMCAGAGLEAYEVSNHAARGAESRHNLLYWRYGEYVGVGPGAHSRIVDGRNRIAVDAVASPELWRAAVAEGRGGQWREKRLTADQCADEMLLMGLRLNEGVSLGRLREIGGRVPSQRSIDELGALGLLYHDRAAARIRATPQGRLVLDSVIAAL